MQLKRHWRTDTDLCACRIYGWQNYDIGIEIAWMQIGPPEGFIQLLLDMDREESPAGWVALYVVMLELTSQYTCTGCIHLTT